jgi:hypothetical protein
MKILNRVTGKFITEIADLQGADLREVDLQEADLRGADLRGADLRGADLRGAYLRGADLQEADLQGANLREANLRGANLRGADLPSITKSRLSILPEGELIGYKKLSNGVIAKLRIPANAKRSNSTGRKCRCEFAEVLEGEGRSQYNIELEYTPGKIVRCNRWEEDWTVECGGGIHFFITKEEAKCY